MRVTIDIPGQLAERLEAERDRVVEILERGLEQLPGTSPILAREMIAFLAADPSPREILEFRASTRSQDRARELLEKNREGTLTPEEESEMDEIEALDDFFAVLRRKASRALKDAA